MEDEFDRYYSEEQLAALVRKLNLFCSDHSPWRPTCARQPHEDLFAQPIRPGETYYRRQASVAYDDVIKLSRRSMAKMVYCLTHQNHLFERLASQLQSIADERERREIAKLE